MMEYKKYRWFYTSEDTLVVGGKSAEQNDKLLREILETKKEYYVIVSDSSGCVSDTSNVVQFIPLGVNENSIYSNFIISAI